MTTTSTAFEPSAPPTTATPSASPAGSYAYVGTELSLFEHAHNWKAYWASAVTPHLRGHVLEVGAGTGNNTRRLMDLGRHTAWTCLEPDASLDDELRGRIAADGLDADAHLGTLRDLPADATFDTLLYADVLEHIEADRDELVDACGRLRPGGRVVVLSPAHQSLFSPFDDAVGHFRRYSVDSVSALTPPGLKLVTAHYLDAVGLAASFANRALLQQSMPTVAQIRTWDRWMVPVSRRIDALFGHRIGKSVLAVWER